jgi:prephenate dehydrogenase
MYAVVAGQTSVKAPEKAAFEKYLPEDVHIVSCHSLHGPTVNPVGQPLVGLILLFPRNIITCTKIKGNHSTSWIQRSTTIS